METVLFIIGLALSGLVIGGLARLLLPGRDPMSLFQTMLVGVVGSLVAVLIAYYAFDREEGAGFLGALVCSFLLVLIIRKTRGSRDDVSGSGPPAERRV